MNRIFLTVSLVSFAAVAADPKVDSAAVSFEYAGDISPAVITYTLTGAPAVVTVDIQTNVSASGSGAWVSVGGVSMGELKGDANRVVRTLDRPTKAYWFPSQDWAHRRVPVGCIRATVTAWPLDCPPDYMSVGLLSPDTTFEVLDSAIRYYASTNDLPGGFDDIAYRTTRMLMRKIPAKGVVWLMGSPTRLDDPLNATTNDVAHRVMFTEDYYAGVFELTQGQVEALGFANESLYAAATDAKRMPAERLGHTRFRGALKNYTFVKKGHEVDGASIVGVLRSRTGIADMDLPTEAQWEYACRAGTETVLPRGLDYSVENLNSVACTLNNRAKVPGCDKTGPRPVGSFRPNDWGLYDTIGNVWELCLDLMGTSTTAARDYLPSFKASLAADWATGGVTVDPRGADNASGRIVKRGGSHNERYPDNSSFLRNDGDPEYAAGSSGTVGYIGGRLFCSVPAAVK